MALWFIFSFGSLCPVLYTLIIFNRKYNFFPLKKNVTTKGKKVIWCLRKNLWIWKKINSRATMLLKVKRWWPLVGFPWLFTKCFMYCTIFCILSIFSQIYSYRVTYFGFYWKYMNKRFVYIFLIYLGIGNAVFWDILSDLILILILLIVAYTLGRLLSSHV